MKQKEITVKQAAALTGYTEGALAHACKRGEIKARKVARKWLCETDSILDYGKRDPFRKQNKMDHSEVMETLDLIEPDALDEAADPVLAAALETRSARHTDAADWKKVLIATYEDLLEQYHRGFSAGFHAAMAYREEDSADDQKN